MRSDLFLQLIITEKPSVAQDMAAYLGSKERKNGYFIGKDYLISWCVGHLVELAPPEAYAENLRIWQYETLPIIPTNWQLVVPKARQKQFNVLNKLLHDETIHNIICATDAGREGELIFRLVYALSGCKKRVQRLWLSSLEEDAIKEGLADLKPWTDYESLYLAALCRAKADWLLGINATRLFSVLYRKTLPVGRVMTPTLALLIQREQQIDGFKTEEFYKVQIQTSVFTAETKKLSSKDQAEAIAAACQNGQASIKKISLAEQSSQPPQLFDLTSLQSQANHLFGFTAQQTLDYAQSLYEKKLLTYPRTESQFISSSQKSTVLKLLDQLKSILPLDYLPVVDFKAEHLVDDKNIHDHPALLPTSNCIQLNLEELPKGEYQVLLLVMMRLYLAAANPGRKKSLQVQFSCAKVDFFTQSSQTIEPGWLSLERAFLKILGKEEKDNESDRLLDLKEGQVLPVEKTTIRVIKTVPPPHFSEGSLLTDLKVKGLGTPATRAGIIEKLLKTDLIKRTGEKKAQLLESTPKGLELITVLPDIICSAELTAEWEKQLDLIEKGQIQPEVFMKRIEDILIDLIGRYQAVKPAKTSSGAAPLGLCPHCQNPVHEYEKLFACRKKGCRFVLWKNNRYLAARGINLNAKLVRDLLTQGQSQLSAKNSTLKILTLMINELGQPRFKLSPEKKG